MPRYGSRVGVVDGKQYYAFPSFEQLASATEEELRAKGFGYRAKFIVGTVKQVQQDGGTPWLHALQHKTKTRDEVAEALTALPVSRFPTRSRAVGALRSCARRAARF